MFIDKMEGLMVTKTRKPGMYKGCPPMSSDFIKIGEVSAHGFRFGIYVKLSSSKGAWINFKAAILGGDMAPKANFWMAWSKVERVFARSRDFEIAEQHFKDLLPAIESVFLPWIEANHGS